jgi:hypothetical protein
MKCKREMCKGEIGDVARENVWRGVAIGQGVNESIGGSDMEH